MDKGRQDASKSAQDQKEDAAACRVYTRGQKSGRKGFPSAGPPADKQGKNDRLAVSRPRSVQNPIEKGYAEHREPGSRGGFGPKPLKRSRKIILKLGLNAYKRTGLDQGRCGGVSALIAVEWVGGNRGDR